MFGRLLAFILKLLLGSNAKWIGSQPSNTQRLYFANHSSHLDTVVLWTALTPWLRKRTRPVAAHDYWGKPGLRRWFAKSLFNAVLIHRERTEETGDPLSPVHEALQKGDSLIFFPEGTRNPQPTPAPFKSGLYYLSQAHPSVELVPVYLENLHRSMPKGSLIPVPLLCSVRFGAPLQRIENESKAAFLERARDAVESLS